MFFDRRLWALTQGLRARIAGATFLGLAASILGIARFVVLGILLARVFAGAGLVAIAVPAAGVAAAVLLRGGVEHWRTMVAHRTAARVQERLRARLYDKIAELGPAWFAGERTGGVMLSIVDGVEQLQTFFGQYLPQLTVAVLTPLAIFGFILWWDVPVAAVMLGAALVTLVAPTAFVQLEGRSSRGRQQALKAFGSEFLDGVQGLPTLKAFGQSAAYGRRLALRARALCDSTLEVLSIGVMTRGITDCGVAVGAAAALSLGAWRVSHGLMSLQALLIVLMPAPRSSGRCAICAWSCIRGWSDSRPPPASTRCSPPSRWSRPPPRPPRCRRCSSRISPSRRSASPIRAGAGRRMTE